MIPRNNTDRNEWLTNRKAKFTLYPFYESRISSALTKEADHTYQTGVFFSTILCINIALNHLLLIITVTKPDSRGHVSSTVTIARQAKRKKILSFRLFTEIEDFQVMIRDEIEHKKTLVSMYRGFFQYLEKKDPTFFDYLEEIDEVQDSILPYLAYRAMDIYYCVCDEWFDFLIKSNERKALGRKKVKN